MNPVQVAVNKYRREGFATLAIQADAKVPAVKAWEQWQERAPTVSELKDMFPTAPRNVALICGQVSGGLAVLDIDNLALADAVAKDIGLQVETTMVRTPRGGLHIYCIETEAVTRCHPVEGVGDLKANGGYVLAPPSSIHGREYATITNSTIKVVPNAYEWAVEVLRAYDVGIPEQQTHEPLDTALVLEGVPEGERDAALFRLACKLRRADVPRETTEKLVLEAAANCSPPFSERAALEKVASAYRYPPGSPDAHPNPLNALNSSCASAAPWPSELAAEALYGLPGDIVRTLDPHTEADPAGILLYSLIAFGNAAGQDAHARVGADLHPPRLDGVLVGKSGISRKGMTGNQVMDLFRAADEVWWKTNRISGLSTGEGLIWAVRDPITKSEPIKEKGLVTGYQDIQVDPGVTDKRLMVEEPEFGRPLRVSKREGNTLSAVIRQAWDSGNLHVMTKGNPARATGAHISIVGHITSAELLRELDSTEAANGFGNRFLWMAVQRSKLLPFGGSLPPADRGALAERIAEALDFAQTAGEVTFGRQAAEDWGRGYEALSSTQPGLFGDMTARASAQVLRLATVYALMDLKTTISRDHLKAALAVWKRCESTVSFVFGDTTGDSVADTILRALRAPANKEGLSRSSIYDLMGRNTPRDRISLALEVLQERHLATCAKADTGGRPVEAWRAA